MNPKPIIFALANPDPEIDYHEAKAARPDAIVATGRSDHPNQVNNVLGFPLFFVVRWTPGPLKSTKP
jgi:malate dehydrogenase (oxaloacetate-decarboxylating)(NADP+)